jgi:hydrogenase expression/formation protein HypD
MRFLDEYRGGAAAQEWVAAIRRVATRPWNLMEICGGQTRSIMRFGLDELLPRDIRLIHGPGCPVCVTPVDMVDKAVAIAGSRDVLFCTFGDMLRVPGSASDLLEVKSRGGDVRMVYSPLDAVKLARENPGRRVALFAVGFETTAPATALAVAEARRAGLENFSALVSHVLVPPAMEAILSSPRRRVDGFLAAGHVCAITGTAAYVPLAEDHQVPIVVTGFEPLDILQGLYLCIKQLEEGRHQVENQYERLVRPGGNRAAQDLLQEVFTVKDRAWRGLGILARSGLGLREEYAAQDAERVFQVEASGGQEARECMAGQVLQGIIKPVECPAFGVLCTPDHPLGAPMVSQEGACAAYFQYRRHGTPGRN